MAWVMADPLLFKNTARFRHVPERPPSPTAYPLTIWCERCGQARPADSGHVCAPVDTGVTLQLAPGATSPT